MAKADHEKPKLKPTQILRSAQVEHRQGVFFVCEVNFIAENRLRSTLNPI